MTGIIRNLLKKISSESPPDTVPTPESVEPAPATPPPGEEPTLPMARIAPDSLDLPQLIVGCGQSVGKQREHNEDALFALTTNLVSDSTQLPFGLYIIADGMGGHMHGEIASGISVRAMANYIIRKLYLPLINSSNIAMDTTVQEIMQQGVFEAHRSILKEAIGGGTTLTAALIMGNQLSLTHVGDSRAYLIHKDGSMEVITQDHTLVKRLEELGQITPEEAAIHPQRNVLYRALGQGEPFEPDFGIFPIPASGYLLLCSDGLWGVISDKEIHHIVTHSPTPHQACQRLIDSSNAAGGPDNITVILVRMPD